MSAPYDELGRRMSDEAAEQERAYERASADVVLALSSDDAAGIASALDLLVDVVELDDLERAEIERLAGLIRAELEARP
jgi:hypothetical protein